MSNLQYSAAQRLLSVLRFLASSPTGKLEKLTSCLQVPNDIPSVLTELAFLHVQMEILGSDIAEYVNSTNQQELGVLFQRDYLGIRKSVQSLNVSIKGASYSSEIDPSSFVALGYIEAALPKEQLETADEIDGIRKSISALQSTIENSEDLPKVIREWLLDLARMMRDGLDRYRNRGTRGLREQLRSIIGELCMSQETSKEVKRSKPELWTGLATLLDTLIKLATLREKIGPAIEAAWPVVPLLLDSVGGK